MPIPVSQSSGIKDTGIKCNMLHENACIFVKGLCPLQVVKQRRQQLLLPCPLLRRERDEFFVLRQLQCLADALKIALNFGFLQLIQLICHHNEGAPGLVEPLRHGLIIGGGLMAGVHDEEPHGDLPVGEIVLHEPCPAGFFRVGDPCVAVAG